MAHFASQAKIFGTNLYGFWFVYKVKMAAPAKIGKMHFCGKGENFRNNLLKNKNRNSVFGENFQKIGTLDQNLGQMCVKGGFLFLSQW